MGVLLDSTWLGPFFFKWTVLTFGAGTVWQPDGMSWWSGFGVIAADRVSVIKKQNLKRWPSCTHKTMGNRCRHWHGPQEISVRTAIKKYLRGHRQTIYWSEPDVTEKSPVSSIYSCCMVSIVTFEKWEQELRSNCEACREAISFSYSSEKLFRAVTKDSLTRCFKLSGSALPRGVKEWIRYKMKLNLKSRFLVITAFRSLSSLLLMCS